MITGGIWKCGNCTDLGDAKLVHSETNLIDADTDEQESEVEVIITLFGFTFGFLQMFYITILNHLESSFKLAFSLLAT